MTGPRELVVSGAGVMTHAGEGPEGLEALLGEPPRPALERVEDGREVPVGRIGRIRNHPFSIRYDRFGQIDTFSRYAFIAAGHALDDAALPAPDPALEEAGVILGTAFGCQEANWQFDQFSLDPAVGLRGASPLMFKSTVDNAPAGWVSVGYALRGVNATFVSGTGAGAEAVLCAARAIAAERADQVVCGGVERLIPLQIAALYRGAEPPAPHAAEGAAVVVLEDAGAAAQRGHTPSARLLAAARLPGDDAGRLRAVLDDAGIAPADLAHVSLASPPGVATERARRLLADAGIDVWPSLEAERTGDHYAAQGPLSLALVAARLRRGALEGPTLVWAPGEAGEGFAFVLGQA